ncbi:hypothetical protein [Lentzea pudingi]|uniref:hypothetical protein n=1 Tax=Lentzea pudingi TaxID=1789439 RepID=UPI00166EFFC7|nr:hypothetical protein [Lentzea pudingi]
MRSTAARAAAAALADRFHIGDEFGEVVQSWSVWVYEAPPCQLSHRRGVADADVAVLVLELIAP